MLHAADSISAWREEVARVRVMAESDVPGAHQAAQRLYEQLPTDATPADEARILNVLSRIEIYLALTEMATRNAERALEIAVRHGDLIGQAEANLNIALNSINEGRIEAMVKATTASVELVENINRPELLGEALLRMAMLYHRRGQLDEAITMTMQTLEIARRTNHPLSLAYAYQGRGIALSQAEHFKDALENFTKMREMARVAKSKMLEGYAAIGMGANMAKLGDSASGEAIIREAIFIFRSTGAPFALNHASYALADLFRTQGRHTEALGLFTSVVATYERHPNKIGLWYALLARSDEYAVTGNKAAALADAERAYELAKDVGMALYLTRSAQQIAALHAANGDFRRAYEMSSEAAAMISQSEREKMSARVVEVAKRYETEIKRRQIEELTRRNEQQQAELRQRELQQSLLWTVLGGSFSILAGTIFFFVRLRRSHAIIRELNAGLEQRVLSRTAELRQQTRYLRTLIDALPWWVWLKDTSSRYLAVNLAAAEATGHRTDELVGKSDMDLLPREIAEAFRVDDQQVMASRKQKIVEEEQKSTKGTLWMETFKAPVLDEDGTVLGTVGFARDISERKAMEAQREEALAEAQRLARLRSDLLAQISHELRTPLNGILGYAQILRLDPRLDERQKAGVNVIQQSGEHLLTLINDILDSAKIEAGKLELYPSDIDLRRFLRTIAEMITVKAEQKAIGFALGLPPDLPAAVHADEKRLRQVLLNLLSNAIKFTDHGHVSLRVMFHAPMRLRFEVRDSGIGMNREQMAQIFQPFAQTGEVQRRLGGTGLGLAISRQFVRLMGGEIEVESSVGEGSCFSFELDLPTVQAADFRPAAYPDIHGYEGRRRTILVVDDILENRAVAHDMLSRIGFSVHEASNGFEALATAQELLPDLILMDIIMPEMDGLEATRRLRQIPALEKVPVIAVSASATEEDKKRYLDSGLDAFLPKPLVLAELLVQIGTQLKLTWLYSEGGAVASKDADPDSAVEVPPPQEMEILLRLARIGNMDDIVTRAKYLVDLDVRYKAFAAHLEALARSFQSKAILKFIREALDQQMQD